MEQWKQVVGYPGYSVSSLGRVRNDVARKGTWAGRILRPGKTKAGYWLVVLCQNGTKTPQYVHRLEAIAFLPNLVERGEVNHLNSDPGDNRLENLEWTTEQENQVHSWRYGLRRPGRARLTADEVRAIRALRGTLSSPKIGPMFGVTSAAIRRIWQRRVWPNVT